MGKISVNIIMKYYFLQAKPHEITNRFVTLISYYINQNTACTFCNSDKI